MSNLEKKKALIVSVSDYENLENLEFCNNDGEQMYEVLSSRGYEIPENRKLIGTVKDGTVRKAIIDFFRDDSNNTFDTLLFYFSGHGVLDGFEGRYFATSNINSQIPEENGIPFEFLTQQMDRSTSRKTIAVIDCCFSGSAIPGVTGKGTEAEIEAEKLGREALTKQFKSSKGKCVLASSLSQRRSYNLPDKKMSAFTHFIVEGLRGKRESVDRDGYVTPEKLDEYVFAELSKFKEHAQTPVRNLSISGRISLAHYPELAQREQTQQENQENSHYGFWTDVKNKVDSAIKEIQKSPVIDPFSKSAIESIPVVGIIFVKLYEKSTLPDEQKTIKIQKIFNYASELEENKLEEFCRILQKHRTEIIEDPEYLVTLSSDPSSLCNYLSNEDNSSKTDSSSSDFTPDTVSNIKESPQSASEIFEIGVSLFMDKKYEDAAKTFDKVVTLEPGFIDAIRFKGRSLAALNRHQAAVFYFNKVLQSSSDDIVVLFLKANSLLSLGDNGGAVTCYDQILKIQPENDGALKKRDEILDDTSGSRFGLRKRFRK